MKHIALFFILLLLLSCLSGCADQPVADIAATTLPVYTFASRLCQGTPLSVTQLVTESVSCLHDYTLQVGQMRAIQGAKAVIISGAGLEEFMEDALHDAATIIDASQSLSLLEGEHHHDHDHGHAHEEDPHIWLSPENAKVMAHNICHGLEARFPQYAEIFEGNLENLEAELDALQAYGEQTLSSLSCRELITFHDGFSYFAESFDLSILMAVEEESGSEASAAQLAELCRLVEAHHLPAIFTETNGSLSAAGIIARETGAALYSLDMIMSGEDYFTLMYRNIDTIKEALQ
jgi:ABC-type Zn uptake system ZnuABC Zn-binding protein ZnuA